MALRIRGPSSLELIRVINQDGEIVAPELLEEIRKTFTREDVLEAHRTMVMIQYISKQLIDDATSTMPRRATLGITPIHEHAFAGAKKIMRPHDKIVTYGRYWDVDILKGVKPQSAMDGYYENPDPESIADFLEKGCDVPRVSVGIQITLAVGQSLRQKILKDGFFAVWVFFGDGATAEGYFHESLNIASVLNLPVIFVCRNNQWAISTRQKETTRTQTYAEKALAYNMAFLRAEGRDMFAIYYAAKKAREYVEQSGAPILLETVSYRIGDHTTAVGGLINPPRDEFEEALISEPLRRNRLFLMSRSAEQYFGIRWTREDELALHLQMAGGKLFRWAAHDKTSRFLGLDWITAEDKTRYQDIPRGLAEEISENSYTNSASALVEGEKIITAWGHLNTEPIFEPLPVLREQEYPLPERIKEATCLEATAYAQYFLLLHDKKTFLAGEDLAPGGVMRSSALHKRSASKFLPNWERDWEPKTLEHYLPLHELFPGRVINTPLCENGIVGVFGTGAAQNGLRPIAEIQFDGFSGIAFDQIWEAAEEVQRKAGLATLPLVIRLPYGAGKRISRHQTCTMIFFANLPGLVIAAPSTVQDQFDLLVAAGRCNRPVLFYEHIELYRPEMMLNRLGWCEETEKGLQIRTQKESLSCELLIRLPWQPIERFGARIAKVGKSKEETERKSLTVVTYGAMVYECLKAAEIIEAENPEASIEIIDLRIIKPIDTKTIIESVKKTGKIVTVQEEPTPFGIGAEILAELMETPEIIRQYLESPARRVGSPQVHNLLSKTVKFVVPDYKKIAESCRDIIYERFQNTP